MKPFVYHSPASAEEAVKRLGADALPLAGGTSLLNLMKERVLEPAAVVNLKTIRGLDKVEPDGEGVRIGANATLASLLENSTVRKQYTALAQAIESIAGPQIRNQATLGGNLCAATPCWYFIREGFSCTKKRAGEVCAAKDGDNEYHAIFATDGPCVAVHASSTAPALVALGATLRVAGPSGSREVALDRFYVLPKDNVHREVGLAANEIITHVLLPKGSGKSATYVVQHRASNEWPVSLAAVALEMQGGTCRSARVCLGAVAPVPWRSAAAERALAGKAINDETAGKAAEAAVSGAAPLAQNAYKLQTARAAVKRAVLLAATGKWM